MQLQLCLMLRRAGRARTQCTAVRPCCVCATYIGFDSTRYDISAMSLSDRRTFPTISSLWNRGTSWGVINMTDGNAAPFDKFHAVLTDLLVHTGGLLDRENGSVRQRADLLRPRSLSLLSLCPCRCVMLCCSFVRSLACPAFVS